MEFRIQRYKGDDEENAIPAEKQTDLFQARIEERRQRKNEQLQKSVVMEERNDEEEEEVVKHKRKKKKAKDDDDCDIIVVDKKKKKKHHKSTSNVEVNDVEEDKEDMGDTELLTMCDDGVGLNENIEVTNNTEDGVTNNTEDGDRNNTEDGVNITDMTEHSTKNNMEHKQMNLDEQAGNDDIHNDDVDTCPTREGDHSRDNQSNILKENHVSNVEVSNQVDATQTQCNSIVDTDNLIQKEQTPDDVIKNGDHDENNDKSNEIQSDNYFPILGKHNNKKIIKTIVKRSLPRWLDEPVFMSSDINLYKVNIKDVDFLSEILLKNLSLNNIDYLFPVQFSVIQKVISQSTRTVSKFPPRDICVQAPTGSGKTLAYVLPIIDVLSKLIVRQLYCLIILPSKDLAVQVHKVLDTYIKGTHLKVALASGLKTFSKEQENLVTKGDHGCCSKVDIVVCTPGRLVDHLKQTRGFNLKYLRFLVVDEADRLLGQDYSSWLDEVKMSVHSSNGYSQNRQKIFPINASAFLGCQMPFQKLLFSATLTQNPEKLAALELYHPLLFTSKQDLSKMDQENDGTPIGDGDRFIIPDELEEKMVIVEADEKPLVLVYLMLSMMWKGVLCFTNSIAATHRLCLLLQSFEGFTVAEFSSNLSETQRKGIIRDFNNGKVDLLISSDAMSRGMDIDTVKLVVNYDTAANAKTYVHRVGRTARAGKKGCAITILHSKEVYHFKLMMKKLSRKVVPKLTVSKETLTSYQVQYGNALSSLQDKISLENRNVNTGSFVKRT